MDYAIYRAIQGKPIPTRKIWDIAQNSGWTGGFYKKDRYFDTEIFSGEFASKNSEYAKAYPKHSPGTTWVIEKADGTLGKKTGTKAYLNVDFKKLLEALEARGMRRRTDDKSHVYLYEQTRIAIQRVNKLLISSKADTYHYFEISEHANPSPGWLKINDILRDSVAKAKTIEELDLHNRIAKLAVEQFGLDNDQGRLISGQDKLSIYLGNENWFSLLFSHCLDPKIYKLILEGEARVTAHPEKQASTIESSREQGQNRMELQNELFLVDIVKSIGAKKFYVDIGMAAQKMDIPIPFSRIEADEILSNTQDLSSGIENYTSLFPGIDDDIDVLYDLAIMTSQSYKSVCSIAKGIGWEKGCSVSVQNQLAGLLAGAEGLGEIFCSYADKMFEEVLTKDQKSLFGCNTIADICRITGASSSRAKEVQVDLGFISPLSLKEANKISIELVGQPIKLEYIKRVITGPRILSSANEVENFSYKDIDDICEITGKSSDEVAKAASDLFCVVPYTLVMADRLAGRLCGVPSIHRLHREKQAARHRKIERYLQPGVLVEQELQEPQGAIDEPKGALGAELEKVTTEVSRSPQLFSSSATSLTRVEKATDLGNRNLQHAVAQDYRKVPIFSPSKAVIPEGFASRGSEKDDLLFALENPELCVRTFFNDLPLLESGNWIESTLFVPAFNEGLYSQLVIEYHRYSMTQLRDQKNEVVKQAERRGAGVGALLGFITGGGIMAPFAAMMGANINKMTANNIDPSRPIEEFLPDPKLLFTRDEGSFMALERAYQSTSIKRRVCLRKVEKEDGRLYWEVFPMILLDRQATPAQVFKWENNYFLRPITAGLSEDDNSCLGYNPFKMRRSLSYHPAHDITVPSEFMTTSIIGPTIDRQPVIFKTGLKEDRSFPHFYFDYPKETQLF